MWEDHRNGNWDIYLHDLRTNTEQQITAHPANQFSPAISSNRIVWEDERDGEDFKEIYMIELPQQPPVLASLHDRMVVEGQLLTFAVSASDSDGDALMLSARQASEEALPAGASFVDHGDGTGTFAWTPDYNQAGGYQVTFTASDGALSDSETITITVQDVPLQVISLTDAPDPFSPNGDGINDAVAINGAFDRPVDWRFVIVSINNGPSRVFGFPAGSATAVSALWDGKDQAGVLQPDGLYTYFVAGGLNGGEQAQRSGTITLDRTAPAITNVSPTQGLTTTNRYVGFSASLADNAALKEAKLFLDGTLVKTQALSGSTASVSSRPRTALSYGSHTYRLEVRDFSNNLATLSRSFIVKRSITKPPPPPRR